MRNIHTVYYCMYMGSFFLFLVSDTVIAGMSRRFVIYWCESHKLL